MSEEKVLPIVKQKHCLGTPARIRSDPAIKKIDTAQFQGIFTEELRALIELFKKYNYELRIAGGAVRDILMDLHPKDVDLATTATPEQMKEMFTTENIRMINTKGERHGTITPRINDKENFEVTTLRIDVITDGRHAEVQFTTDWQLDANRRDLTINSMFLGFDGTVYDYFYGYEDLEERRVIFVGDAAARIKEDYLRILRYFRFYGRIAREPNKHDETTLKAIKENSPGLERISGERIWTELQKIVVGNFNMELVLKMLDCELGPFCGLPLVPNVKEFERVCKALANFPKPHVPITYLIALLNTCADAGHLHERLKLSAFERDLGIFITHQRHKIDAEYSALNAYQKLCLLPNARRDFVEELLRYGNKVEYYNTFKDWVLPKFPLNGNMLKERGCPQDRHLGFILNQLQMAWANSNFELTVDDLLDNYLPVIMEDVSTMSKTPIKKRRTSK